MYNCLGTQVAYGSNDISVDVKKYSLVNNRMSDCNVAVFEYFWNGQIKIITASSDFGRH